MFFVLISLLLANCHAKIEQVHLSLSNAQDEMTVTWVTKNFDSNSTPFVRFGTTSTSLTSTVKATVTKWKDEGSDKSVRYTYRATMKQLEAGQRYYYSVGSEAKMSNIFNFAQPDPAKPLRAAVFADLSILNGFSIEPLINATENGEFDVVFHIGDFAYDLDSKQGQLGDDFMNAIEPMTSRVPYMTVAGNHEETHDFNHYINRFSMPKNGVLEDNQFWSVDIGPIHLIGISTEYYGYHMSNEAQLQYNWLQADLKKNTGKWTIVFMHRPMYCSSRKKDGCEKEENIMTRNGEPGYPGLEKLFNKHGVDMVFWAHEHTYERYWPMYEGKPHVQPDPNNYHNSPTPVFTLSGAAGCHSHLLPNETIAQPFSVKRLGNYGYSILTIHNSTHVSTGFIDVQSKHLKNLDPFVLTKDSDHKPGAFLRD